MLSADFKPNSLEIGKARKDRPQAIATANSLSENGSVDSVFPITLSRKRTDSHRIIRTRRGTHARLSAFILESTLVGNLPCHKVVGPF